MKTKVIILAGGEGTRLGVLTAKRTKPAVPFGGKYRIIDFALSNCVNSNLFDVMIIAQYRPHSLLEHIGAGGPWDLNRDFTGGVRIYTPYKSTASEWFQGTADAIQQNFTFIKRDAPDLILVLSGDHIYTMDYSAMIRFHLENKADVTIATLEVPLTEAHRFGIVDVAEDFNVRSFVEKPQKPPSNLANMGVYLFNTQVLDQALWVDHLSTDSSHDFGKDILPKLVRDKNTRMLAFPYRGYWVDVGTVQSYWLAHMDLLKTPSPVDLHNRDWIIHTRTEEQPPAKIQQGAIIENSMICDGCIIESGARITRSILSPGVRVSSSASITESVILTNTQIKVGCTIQRSVIDKGVLVSENSTIGEFLDGELSITMVGRKSIIPPDTIIHAGAIIGTDVIPEDFTSNIINGGQLIQTRRLPYEV
jgi:glucose-1-phosphate adenylyltransferase